MDGEGAIPLELTVIRVFGEWAGYVVGVIVKAQKEGSNSLSGGNGRGKLGPPWKCVGMDIKAEPLTGDPGLGDPDFASVLGERSPQNTGHYYICD